MNQSILPPVQWLVSSLCAVALVLGTGCAGLPKHLAKTTRITEPPAGKAIINFGRPTGYGGNALYPIFDGDGKFICDLPGKAVFQYVCDPGKHVFIGWAEHVSVVEVDAAPNKIYDILVDVGMGWIQANIKMAPLTKTDPRRAKLPEFDQREKNVLTMMRDKHVTEYEAKNQARVQEIKKDFFGGPKSDRVLRLQPDDCR